MAFDFQPTKILNAMLITNTVFGDERGFFMETYHRDSFAQAGISTTFVQDNHSKSKKGVLRGLHFQTHHTQAKLVRVVSGAVLDIVVDCRSQSPSYGQHIIVELNETNKQQLFVPKGCAHGFLTLADDTEFLYKCDDLYAPQFDSGVHYADPDIGIDRSHIMTTYGITDLIVSAKDQQLPSFQTYQGSPAF